MTSSSQKDLWLVIVLSLIGLALIWLLPTQSNSFTLITYFLLLFLLGYSLISIIKPQYDFLNKIIIGFLLGLFFLYLILVVAAYLNMNYLNGLLTSLLFLLAIIFSLLALHQRRTKYKEGQLTLDESLRRIQEIKKRSEEVSLSEEMEEYTPMPEEVEEASLKNRMSVMRLYDTGKKPEGEKNSQQLKDFLDKNP